MLYLFLFIIGTAVGSFLNVLIDRLPNEKSINGRSHCDYCKKALTWYDLVPVISFLYLGGRCRYCQKKLSWQYPGIEVLTGVIFVFVGISGLVKLDLLVILGTITLLGIMSVLIVVFFADVKYRIIPDSMQVGLLVFGIMWKISLIGQIRPIGGDWAHSFIIVLLNSFVAAFVVMLPILLLFAITRGKGMGFGDVKFAFNMGFILGGVRDLGEVGLIEQNRIGLIGLIGQIGIIQGLTALYLAFLLGGIIGLILMLTGRKKLKSKIAFGPFLVIGLIIMLFWQKEVFEIAKKIFNY